MNIGFDHGNDLDLQLSRSDICYISASNGPIVTKQTYWPKALNVTIEFDFGHDFTCHFQDRDFWLHACSCSYSYVLPSVLKIPFICSYPHQSGDRNQLNREFPGVFWSRMVMLVTIYLSGRIDQYVFIRFLSADTTQRPWRSCSKC